LRRIDFATHVEWHERRTLLKVAFPVDIRASHATYEIQFGTIQRATHQNTEFDRARFEVPAQRWADLSEGNYGVSLLNDCKYGYDVKGNQLRLSLLRAPVHPDPEADQGEHDFTYSLLPHTGDWRTETVREAAQLNVPLRAVLVESKSGPLPSRQGFASVNVPNVVIDAVKRAEDSDSIIVRFYEAYGQRGNVTLTFAQTPIAAFECDLMEEGDAPLEISGNSVTLYVTPYQIRTLKLRLA
jgi:alpha-mannosidase